MRGDADYKKFVTAARDKWSLTMLLRTLDTAEHARNHPQHVYGSVTSMHWAQSAIEQMKKAVLHLTSQMIPYYPLPLGSSGINEVIRKSIEEHKEPEYLNLVRSLHALVVFRSRLRLCMLMQTGVAKRLIAVHQL